MADKNIGIALILSARNQASAVIDEFFNKTEAKMQALAKGSAKIAEGMGMIWAGKKGIDELMKTKDAFEDVQEAQISMKTTMMGKGGIYDESTYKRLTEYAEYISDNFTGTQAAYTQMFQELMRNRIDPKLILGGLGEEVAKLGVLLDTPPATIAEFTAHMINDAGVSAKKARDVMDMVARFSDMGVGKTGGEAVTAMTDYFGKASLGMKTLGWQGVEATKTVGLLGSMFIAMGLQANTVGTNIRRIEDGLRSTEKVKLVSQGAKMLGKDLIFNDKKGKSLGPENMIKQFEKLKGLAPGVIEAILKPFGGKQGLSTDFIEAIAGGQMDFEKFKRQYEAKAAFEIKFNERMKGLRKQEEVFASNMRNAMARIGMAIAPVFAKILHVVNSLVVHFKEFAKANPSIIKLAAGFVAIGSASLMLLGIIKVVKGITMVMRVLNITMAMNPILMWATIFAAVTLVIYTYWEPIKGFFLGIWKYIKAVWSAVTGWFKNMWSAVSGVFMGALHFIKKIFWDHSPAVLIYKHWDKITGFFHNLWGNVKKIFTGFMVWMLGLGTRFFEAGKNIVKNIWQGIKNMAHKPIEAIKAIVHKIRQYLPFSPAKEGPLRDIHRVKLVETIAMSLKPDALISAWHNVLGSFSNAVHGGKPLQLQTTGSGGMAPFNFNVTVNLMGGAGPQDAKLLTDAMKRELDKWYRDMMGNRERVSYG